MLNVLGDKLISKFAIEYWYREFPSVPKGLKRRTGKTITLSMVGGTLIEM